MLESGVHIVPQTLLQYEKAIRSYAKVLDRLNGPRGGSGGAGGVVNLSSYSLQEHCDATNARMLDICLASVQLKPDTQLSALSAALNFFTVRQGCAELNPFKTTAVKWKKATLSATMRRIGGGRKHAPGISSDGLRRLISWLMSARPAEGTRAAGGMSHANVHVRLGSVRLAAALVVAWWTAMRGGSLLGLRLEHIQVIDDPSNTVLKYTMCVWLPTQKNDVDGEKGGAWFPLTPNARDAYLCPALWTSIWIDLNADAFAAASRMTSAAHAGASRRERLLAALSVPSEPAPAAARSLRPTPSLPDLERALAPRTLSSEVGSFLFSSIDPSSGVAVTRGWSKASAGRALSAAVSGALGPGVKATLHSPRQSFMTRAAIARLPQTAASTWGGWEGHDVLNYTRQDLDAMLNIGRELAGMVAEAPVTYLPYGSKWTSTGGLPLMHNFDRIRVAAERTILAFSSAPGRVAYDPLMSLEGKMTFLSRSFPLYEPIVDLVALGMPPRPFSSAEGVGGPRLLSAASASRSYQEAASFFSTAAGNLCQWSSMSYQSAMAAAAAGGNLVVSALGVLKRKRVTDECSTLVKPDLPYVSDVLHRDPPGWSNVYDAWHGSLGGLPAVRDFRVNGVFVWVSRCVCGQRG